MKIIAFLRGWRTGIVRIIAFLRGWRTGRRIEGEWYWVTNGEDTWPAVAYTSGSARVMGWSNLDTWEDFYGEVVAWKHIRAPIPPNINFLKRWNLEDS